MVEMGIILVSSYHNYLKGRGGGKGENGGRGGRFFSILLGQLFTPLLSLLHHRPAT